MHSSATICIGNMLGGAEPIQDMTKRVSKVVGAKLNRGNCRDKRRDGIACQDFLLAALYKEQLSACLCLELLRSR